ncbi:uncharacterized protein BO88DRAFT_201137 [Aspergillus vadensis CBS 113365]|uniref:Uncharacterized protein n=1 Tax=Aspergillus vadensis (strain CBS 113365 / IMI 142717 / IBT 24658) TaxID=1448311 RepID=A0A319BI37_ASPVC|nr:hypothetical protein BO88DRAFT_201137 [Aspergillus vadensis CBS 113365]PYH71931.1 hypothetical protein BO88DRAFT_201137 [Aspergillus vadensis CBS 113365]
MRGVRGPIQEHPMTSYSFAFGVAFERAAAVERNGRSRSIFSFDEIPNPLTWSGMISRSNLGRRQNNGLEWRGGGESLLGMVCGLQARGGGRRRASFVVCALNNAFKFSLRAHAHTAHTAHKHTSITHLASPMSIPAMMELVSTCLSPLGWQIPFHFPPPPPPLSVREIDRSCHTVYMMCMNQLTVETAV